MAAPQTDEKGALTPWPPLRGGSARRRWGRELYGCPKYFGLWQGSLPPPLRGTSLAEGGFQNAEGMPRMRHPFLRFERVHCRGGHCSPLPVCFARKLSRKMRCCAKSAGDQWSPLHMQQARGCRGARGGSPGHPSQECGAQFSVTVMVPILVLSAVVLPNAPLRESAAVPLGASSTAVPTAVRRSSCALSKLPLMPSKPVSAA